MTMTTKIHPFQASGLGTAPFRFVSAYEDRGPKRLADGSQVGAPGQPMGTCQHCGTGIAYCCVVESSDGQRSVVGSDCVQKTDAGVSRAARPAVASLAAEASRKRKAVATKAQARTRLRLTVRSTAPEVRKALRLDHGIAQDMRSRMIRTGRELSEAQVSLLLRLQEQADAPAEQHVPVPVNGKRIVVEGTIVGLKSVVNDYGAQWKMIVKVETPDGSWLCYGSEPAALGDQMDEIRAKAYAAYESGEGQEFPEPSLKGSQVRFTAKVVPGGRDPHFGFFSRPTKATIITPAFR